VAQPWDEARGSSMSESIARTSPGGFDHETTQQASRGQPFAAAMGEASARRRGRREAARGMPVA
jgi:hypothetical protein